MSDAPMNAAQRQALEKAMGEHLARTLESMKLRQWAMEQAVGLFVGLERLRAEVGYDKPVIAFADPVALATGIYDFVSKPAADFMSDGAVQPTTASRPTV
jgi:hypothetical protein